VRPGFSMAWAGSILLFVQGAIAVLWLLQGMGLRRGALLAAVVAFGAFIGETVGVATGFPFGPYHYTGILFPRLPGSVPLPVVGAWLLVVATSVGVARWVAPPPNPLPTTVERGIYPQQPLSKIVRLSLAGMEQERFPLSIRRWGGVGGGAVLLGVALDLVLDPVAVRIEGYWLWGVHGPYYGIPLSNFVGWAALCALLCGTVVLAWPRGGTRCALATVAPIPELAVSAVWLYVLTDVMFTFIDLTHGLWLAAGIGAATLGCLALRWRATYDRG
jgi:putative membrane protein